MEHLLYRPGDPESGRTFVAFSQHTGDGFECGRSCKAINANRRYPVSVLFAVISEEMNYLTFLKRKRWQLMKWWCTEQSPHRSPSQKHMMALHFSVPALLRVFFPSTIFLHILFCFV